MGTQHEPQDEYSFIQETIKDEEFNPRKWVAKLGRVLLLGLVFGIAACIAFFALKPWAEETFQKEPSKVDLDIEDQEKEDAEDNSEQNSQDIVEAERELTIADYSKLVKLLNGVAKEAKKSVVTISGVEEEDPTASVNSHKTTSGVIVADNGRELLILGKYSCLKDMELYRVEFVDGHKQQATLKQKDKNLDFAIYSVAKDKLSEGTEKSIAIAKLGSDAYLTQGMPVLAIGQPFGYEDGVASGVVSSYGTDVILADGEYGIFATDIVFDKNASGILVDMYGYVVGIISSENGNAEDSSTMMAYSMSDIKSEIELMSNGQHVPYAGVVGVMVSEEISELRGIPEGLYVREVEKDSPAMAAGIQSGDVIMKIGDKEINSLSTYRNALYKLEAGETVKYKCQRLGTNGYVDISFIVTVGIK